MSLYDETESLLLCLKCKKPPAPAERVERANKIIYCISKNIFTKQG